MLLPSTPRLFQSPSDQFIVTHRTRTRRDYAQIAKALRRRTDLSDGAYRTYLEIIEFDWEDKSTGTCKGYVFPSLQTLADLRGVTVRTIERHIRELISLGLLSRERRRNKVSVLYIEELLCETEREEVRSDKTVDCTEDRETTKLSIAYNVEITRTQKQQQERSAVVDKLEQVGVAPAKAQELATRYPSWYIEKKLTELEVRLRSLSGQEVGKPAGWLITAIERDTPDRYQHPPLPKCQVRAPLVMTGIDEVEGVIYVQECAG